MPPKPPALPESLAPSQEAMLRILRLALFTGCVVMAGVGYTIGPEASADADPEVAALMLPVLASIAAVAVGVSVFAGGLFARLCPVFMSAMIFRWALAELATVIGLTLSFVGADLRAALALCARGALAILLQPGDARAYERYRAERGGRA